MKDTKRKFKLCFVWDWENPLLQLTTWKDGLAGAIKELSKEWDVKAFSIGSDTVIPHDYIPFTLRSTPEKLGEKILEEDPDAILFWGDFTRPTMPQVADKGIPMACCLAGGTFRQHASLFDLIFVESASYKNSLEAEGYNVRQAFGTNTHLFRPIKQPKLFDAVNTSTYANWKRHKLLSNALQGYRVFTCGWMYNEHERDCWSIPQEKGILIAPHIGMKAISYFLNASHTAVITSNSAGGSQRSVLEALSCGIPPIVMADSEKTSEYVREADFGKIVPPQEGKIREAVDYYKQNPPTEEDIKRAREYIDNNYSHKVYARKLKKGIESIL